MQQRLFFLFLLIPFCGITQKKTFDLVTLTVPSGWTTQLKDKALLISKEDRAKGIYCLVSVYKSITSEATPQQNFDVSWQTLVKESFTTMGDITMQPGINSKGWTAISGYGSVEANGSKGIALLISSTNTKTLVNMLVLTNTDSYQSQIDQIMSSIDFKTPPREIAPVAPTTNAKVTSKTAIPARKDGFQFTTTNFDDGWKSTAQEDWVEATKDDIKVLIHYPTEKIDESSMDYRTIGKNAWNTLVSPRYSNLLHFFQLENNLSYEAAYFLAGDVTDKTTGKTVHVSLFRKGSSGWIEVITKDKASFVNVFKVDNPDIYYGEWQALQHLAGYNRFAIAQSDLKGKWTNNFGGAMQYYYAYTGFAAGTRTHSSVQNYEFGTGNSYKWDINIASGFAGSLHFQNVKTAGQFALPSNWQIIFTDKDKKKKICDAYFSCLKGGRILWISDTESPGYTGFGLSK